VANVLGGGLGAEVLSALTGRARQALPFIISGVSQGLSANAIAQALTAGGMGMRRSRLLKIVQAARGNFATATIYRNTPAAEVPPSYIFFPSTTLMENPFAYILRVTERNTVTGLLGTRHITVSSPVALSNDQIEAYAEKIYAQSLYDYHATFESFDIDSVLVDPRYIP
jgi:hypothetical protein